MRQQVSNSLYGALDYAAYPVGMLLIAPVVLRNLGTASYGVWTVAMAATNLGAIVASGFGDAIIQQVARLRANGVRNAVLRVVRSAIAVHLLLGSLVAATLYVTAPYLAGRLALADSSLGMISLSSTRLAGILVFLRAIETVCISVQRGFERYGAAVRITVVVRLSSLLAAAMLARLSFSVAAIMASTAGITFLGVLIQFILLRHLIGGSSLLPTFDPAAARELFDFGRFTWILAITTVLFSQGDRIISGAAVGATGAVAYAVCTQIAQPVYGITAAGLHFLLPYIAFRRHTISLPALRRIVLRALLLNGTLGGAGVALLLGFSGPILKLVATDAVARSCAPLLPGVVASSALLALTVSGSYAMLAIGDLRPVAAINVAAASVMFLVNVEFLSRDGVRAVIAARLAFAVVALLIYVALFRRLAAIDPHTKPVQGQLAGEEGA